ncbi:hypothetical protein B0O99DRAFT_696022 [Bisporella sp. PMI_857]|nr:hypothetical protein B0O99DRAFT_696022 [Bisporella sp. PMI_857]
MFYNARRYRSIRSRDQGQLAIECTKIFPYQPKAWTHHGVPVEIQFEDKRATSVGKLLFLDYPDEELKFPCYALFLDPAHALMLWIRPGRPAVEEDDDMLERVDHLLKEPVSAKILTSNHVLRG